MLRNSGFMDGVMFSRTMGPMAQATRIGYKLTVTLTRGQHWIWTGVLMSEDCLVVLRFFVRTLFYRQSSPPLPSHFFSPLSFVSSSVLVHFAL